MNDKKTIVFDFDGVIHKYSYGWKEGIIDEPVEGIRELIDKLANEYKIVICSTRCNNVTLKSDMIGWLDKHKIFYDECVSEKVPAIMYIDDRALKFNGNVVDLESEILSFQTWLDKDNKNAKKEMITIPKEKYDDLCKDSLFLSELECEGVDNWDGYDRAKATIKNEEDEY